MALRLREVLVAGALHAPDAFVILSGALHSAISHTGAPSDRSGQLDRRAVRERPPAPARPEQTAAPHPSRMRGSS